MLKLFKAPIGRIFEREDDDKFVAFQSRSFPALILIKRIFVEMNIFLKRIDPALCTVIKGVIRRVPPLFMAMLRHKVIILCSEVRMTFSIERTPCFQLL